MLKLITLYESLTQYQKKYLLLLFLLMFIGMIFEIFGISLIIPLISIFVSDDLVNNSLFIYLGINNIEKNQLLYFGTIIILFVYLAKSLYLLFLLWQQSRFAKIIQTYTSDNLFNLYLNQNYAFHSKHNSSLLFRNVSNTSTIETILHAVCSSILEFLIVIGLAFLLIYINPITAIVSLCSLFFLSFSFYFFSKKLIEKWGRIKLKHDHKRIQYLQQGFGAIKEIKIFNKESIFSNFFSNHNNSYAEINKKRFILLNSTRIFLEFMAILGFTLIIFLSINQGSSIENLLTTLGVFTAAAFRLLPSFNRILVNFNNIRHSLPFLEIYLNEIKTLKYKNNINPDFTKLHFKNSLKLNNISFSYDGKTNVLNNFSIEIKKGEYLGIVGKSGSGKSTLVDIILGLLKIEHGSILIDDMKLEDCLLGWQNVIGYVPQDVYLTDDSITANIAFGVEQNEIDHKRVDKVLEITQLKDFVDGLALKKQTFLGERGARISGGQRQRIGIARALYNDPQVIIFDESTSSLDQLTEKDILDFINTLKIKKTIICISHNTETLSNCDRILSIY